MKIKQLIVVVAAAILAVGGFLAVRLNENDKPQTKKTVQTQTVQKLTVSEDKKTVSYEGQTGKTALEILQTLAEVKTEASSFGDFVSGINGVDADSSKEYWSFYVNGAYASEGAGTYQTKDGEKIEWRLEQL